MDDKSPIKWEWSDHATHFKFWGPNGISGTAEARVIKFYTQVDYNPPLKGRGQGQITPFWF